MRLYKAVLFAVVFALLTLVVKADTRTQTFTLPEIDLLAGETSPLILDRFDPALGELTDVRITYESFRFRTVYRVYNPTDNWISDYSTGTWVLPWFDDGLGSWFPALSITQSMVPVPPCGPVHPVFPPHSAHLFDAQFDSRVPYWCGGGWYWYQPITLSLIAGQDSTLAYWTGTEPLALDVAPSWAYSIGRRHPYAVWPGDVDELGGWFTAEITVTFVYEVTP